MESNLKRWWKDFIYSLRFGLSGEVPFESKEVETEFKPVNNTWFAQVDLETGEVEDVTPEIEEVAYWVPGDTKPVEVPKLKGVAEFDLPFVRFPCPGCQVEIEVDNAIFAGEVGVVKCDGCKDTVAIVCPKLQFFMLRELPPDLQEVWGMVTEDGERENIQNKVD